MVIVEIPSWYKDSSNNIRGSFFFEHASMFSRNHKVYLMFVKLVNRGFFSKIKNEMDGEVTTLTCNANSLGCGKIRLLWKYRMFAVYEKAFKSILSSEKRVDLIVAHSFSPAGIVAMALSKKYGIPFVMHEHSSRVHTKRILASEVYDLKKVISAASKIFCVSESLKKAVIELTGISNKNVIVIPNAVSPIFKYQVIDTLKFSEATCFRFVSVGNLIPEKGQDRLILAFQKAFSNEPVELIIVGDGVQRNRLQEIVDTDKRKHIHLKGRISREEVCALLQSSNVFVLVSDHETFGVSYIEALACGCPIIAAHNGGAEEIVDKTNGLLVNNSDEEELIHSLQYMFLNYNCYNRKLISLNALNKFGFEKVYLETIREYKKLLDA